MKKVKIAINGLGRIGRLMLKEVIGHESIELVAVNDISNPEILAHLIKFDSVHGTYDKTVEWKEQKLLIGDHLVHLYEEQDPSQLPWGKLGIDIVIEATGRFIEKEQAIKHIEAGAKKVIISAPGKNEDVTIVMGVNEEKYNQKRHSIISNASCTTNCLAPLTKVIHQALTIKRGLMTTIHSYTNDQRVLDFPHQDFRRARAAAENSIPTTTGAAKAVGKVLPDLVGKLTGLAVRVPTPNVSLVDVVFETKEQTTVEKVNDMLKKAAETELKGILGYSELPLVSSDYIGTRESCTIDALSTLVLDGNMVKIVAWYDNEVGYSNRLIDLVDYIYQKGI
ncbi:MAG TPA: type I glyceraldehyde-3-phosphate dehydrogenase [Massilibacterium sp.]|nr:type I glyceraldehyde-3-phosphate dehydrogenase [Massilibacterium sp.]